MSRIPEELKQYKECGIVYGLVDPNTNAIRYIGKSIQGINRAFEHCRKSSVKEGNTPKNNWIKKLLANNQMYSVVILFSVSKEDYTKESLNILLYNKEKDLINTFDNLLNLTDGGPGAIGRVLSEESRKKMSDSAKKQNHDHLRKISQSQKLSPEMQEVRKKERAEKMKLRDRKIPGSKFKELVNKGKKIIAKDLNGVEVIGFYATRTAANFLGGKCSHTGIRFAIQKGTIYYGFYWEYV